ncbi:MAG: biotin transporter BioY [Saprospiraceae bacterium]|nr:biotin transporter BioY [Saprospiraceae bacterium]
MSAKYILLVLVGVLILVLGYQFPIEPLPRADYRISISAGVGVGLIIGFLYPRPLEWWTISIFILLGLLNLPVFSGMNFGLEYLKGEQGAYVWGLLPATFAMRLLVQNGWDRSFLHILVSMFIGVTMVFLCGSFWVYAIHGLDRAFSWTILIQVPTYFILGTGCALCVFVAKKLVSVRG